MSASLSIFQKPCPACALSVSVGAERCQCGHAFESSIKNQTPQEAALRDEELYEAYLGARAQQAKQVATDATRALMEEPDDAERMSAAQLASEVASAIAADHAAQCAKIAALRRALPAPPVVIQVVAPEIAPLAARVEVSIVEVRPAQPALVSPARLTPPVVSHTKTTAQKAAGVLVALKNAKAREAAARARAAMVVEQPVAIAKPETAVDSTPSNVPPSTFRQDQATRAEKIMVARTATDTKDCPNCTASVPLNTTRCHCGFAFVANNSDLPSLTLCTGDFTALRDSFNLNLR